MYSIAFSSKISGFVFTVGAPFCHKSMYIKTSPYHWDTIIAPAETSRTCQGDHYNYSKTCLQLRLSKTKARARGFISSQILLDKETTVQSVSAIE